jgi:hypothetical protein
MANFLGPGRYTVVKRARTDRLLCELGARGRLFLLRTMQKAHFMTGLLIVERHQHHEWHWSAV